MDRVRAFASKRRGVGDGEREDKKLNEAARVIAWVRDASLSRMSKSTGEARPVVDPDEQVMMIVMW